MIQQRNKNRIVSPQHLDTVLSHRASLVLREIKTNNDDGNNKITVAGNNIFLGSSKQTAREENQDKAACVHIVDGEKSALFLLTGKAAWAFRPV